MGWKSLAWAGCLAPALAGCGTTHFSALRVADDLLAAHTQRGIEHDLRKDARAAWQCVRTQHPRRAFTAEFHDGFLDGFVDYLDRGGSAQPPAVPPLKYVRNKRYFTPEGQCLVRDYYLGFQYGTDVAIATGRRQFLTVPVLLADGPPTYDPAPAFGDPVAPVVPFMTPPRPPGSSQPMPPPMPLPTPRPVGSDSGLNKFGSPQAAFGDPLEPDDEPPVTTPKPKSDVPAVKPLPPSGTKFPPLLMPPDPDLLPVPYPPVPTLPVPPLPVPDPDKPELPVPPGSGGLFPGAAPVGLRVNLPAPPDEVPTLPAGVPTPSILDDIPVVPFQFVSPPPLPPTLPTPSRK
jgi:hypothetical protein